MKKFIGFWFLILITACSSTLPYRSLGTWDENARTLGPVSFCAGGGCLGSDEKSQWPLALTTAPAQENIHAALLAKASKQYGVPESELLLKDVNVRLLTEVVGTVRGWKATATAGRIQKKAKENGR